MTPPISASRTARACSPALERAYADCVAGAAPSREEAHINRLVATNNRIKEGIGTFRTDYRRLSHWVERRELAVAELNSTEPFERVHKTIKCLRIIEAEQQDFLSEGQRKTIRKLRTKLDRYYTPTKLCARQSEPERVIKSINSILDSLCEIYDASKDKKTDNQRIKAALQVIGAQLSQRHRHTIAYVSFDLLGFKRQLRQDVTWDRVTNNEIRYLLKEIAMCQKKATGLIARTRKMEMDSARGDFLAIHIEDRYPGNQRGKEVVKEYDRLQRKVNDAAKVRLVRSLIRNTYQRVLKFVCTTNGKELALLALAIVARTVFAPVQGVCDIVNTLAHVAKNVPNAGRWLRPNWIEGTKGWKSFGLHVSNVLRQTFLTSKKLGGGLFFATFFIPKLWPIAFFGGGLFCLSALLVAGASLSKARFESSIASDLRDGVTKVQDGVRRKASSIQDEILDLRAYIYDTEPQDLDEGIIRERRDRILLRIKSYTDFIKGSLSSDLDGLINIGESLAASIPILSLGELAQNGPEAFKAFYKGMPQSLTDQYRLIQILKDAPSGIGASPMVHAGAYYNVLSEYHLFSSEDEVVGGVRETKLHKPIDALVSAWRGQLTVLAARGIDRARNPEQASRNSVTRQPSDEIRSTTEAPKRQLYRRRSVRHQPGLLRPHPPSPRS